MQFIIPIAIFIFFAICVTYNLFKHAYRANWAGSKIRSDISKLLLPKTISVILVCPVKGCGKTRNILDLIMHLNDYHMWSREDIAAQLPEYGLDLTLNQASSLGD